MNINQNHFQELVDLFQSGRISSAKNKTEKLIKEERDNPFLLNIYGLILVKTNNIKEAENVYRRAIRISPNYIEPYSNLGILLKDCRKYEEAIELYKKAIQIDPNYAIVYNNLGVVYRKINDIDNAAKAYKLAIEKDKNYFQAYNNLGIVCEKQNKHQESIKYFNDAISLNPKFSQAYNNLGSVHCILKDYEKGISCYTKALDINPNYADAAHNLGHTYGLMFKYRECFKYINLALKLSPYFADAWNTLGMYYYRLGKLSEAKKCFSKAIKINPDLYKARYNLGVLLIREDNFKKGWAEREERRKIEMVNIKNNLEKVWKGEYVKGNLYVWREQGIGDEILFSSNLILLKKLAKKTLLEIDKRLVGLFDRFFKMKNFNNIQIIPYDSNKKDDSSIGNNIRKSDKHIALGSIGMYLLNKKEKFRSINFPYLIPDRKKVNEIKSKFSKKDKIRVGLSWKTLNKKELYRNLPLLDWSSLFNIDGCEFYNLQFGDYTEDINAIKQKFGKEIKTIDRIDYKNDIENIAALIHELDLVITTQNAVAHLSCALGKKTWVLIPTSPRFNWGIKGKKTIWYHSAKVYRQKKIFSWNQVFNEVSNDLKKIRKRK